MIPTRRCITLDNQSTSQLGTIHPRLAAQVGKTVELAWHATICGCQPCMHVGRHNICCLKLET